MQSFYEAKQWISLTGLLALILFSQGCKPPVQELTESEPDPLNEQMVKANQYMQQRHQDHISAFVERVGWNAELSPSGLWVVIENQGSGERITENSKVSYSFESTLLDGTACYKASEQKPKVITIGKGGVESGVEEGMRSLREGATATFLIPPHLGHGNFGDRDRIPGNSVLIYRVKILKVE